MRGTKRVVVTFPAHGATVFYCRFHYVDEPLYQAGELLVRA